MNSMLKEDVLKKLENNLKDYEKKLNAWQNVKRVSKKDGTDFAIKGKNFSGASFGKNTFVEDYAHPYLTVGYDLENLAMFEYVSDLKQDDPRKQRIEQQVINHSCVRDTYIFNVDECFERIEEHIEFLKEKIEDYKNQIKNAQHYIEKADIIINQVKLLLNDKDLKNNKYRNSLGYAIQKYIQENIY